MDILSSNRGRGNIFQKPDLHWGIMSTARIARETIVPAIKSLRHNFIVAVASRDMTRAREFAASMEIPRAYDSYDDLLADPEVQAVYIPLPNNGHAPWAIKALKAGKHVLVEKPFALNADEAQEMVGAALENSVVLMEAFNYRFSTRFNKLKDLIRKGEIGKLRFITSSFTFNLSGPDDIRLKPELGGGVLFDLGCYCVNLQRQLVGHEPLQVGALAYEGISGVDLQMTATLDFGNQVYTHFDVAMNAASQQATRLVGTDGTLVLDSPFSPSGQPLSIVVDRDGRTRKLNFKAEDTYRRMVDHFYHVTISRDLPEFPFSDAVNNMVVLDALFQSAIDNGKPVKV